MGCSPRGRKESGTTERLTHWKTEGGRSVQTNTPPVSSPSPDASALGHTRFPVFALIKPTVPTEAPSGHQSTLLRREVAGRAGGDRLTLF